MTISDLSHPSECDRCLYSSGSPYLRCAVHPMGISDTSCPDFEVDPNPVPVPDWMSEEIWCGMGVVEIGDFGYALELADELLWDELEEGRGKRGEG